MILNQLQNLHSVQVKVNYKETMERDLKGRLNKTIHKSTLTDL